jgi:ribosomal protein S18 acetylase RimI-like enzyme
VIRYREVTDGTTARPLDDGVEIRPAREDEVDELLPLMRAYCDFYEFDPPDKGLRELLATLIRDPQEGAVFIARADGVAVGLATMDWRWSASRGARMGHLEDLFVSPEARGGGIADALIGACAELCRERGAPALDWLTRPDNERAQAVYRRVGAQGESWLEYELEL